MRNLKNRISNIFKKFKGMLLGNLGLLLCLIFISFFGLLSLPNISFQIGEQNISFPKLDLSAIFAGSEVGNFRRGRDLFPTQTVKSTINFGNDEISEETKTNYFKNTLQRVSERAVLVGLTDVDIQGEISNGIYSITFNYPQSYKSVVEITGKLTKKGEIGFVDTTQQPVDLLDSDINTNVELTYNNTIKSHIKFSFTPERSDVLQKALSQKYFYMTIDGVPEYQVFQYEQNDALANVVRGLPIAVETENLSLRELYINITRTYFNEPAPMTYGINVDQNTIANPPIFENLSPRFLAVLSAIAFISITIFSFIKFKFKKGIAFSLMLMSSLVFTVTLLKYFLAPISLSFLVSYFVFSGISILFIWQFLLSESSREVRKISKIMINLGYLLIIACIAILRLIPNLGRIYDALGVLLVFGISFLVLGFFNYRVLTEKLIIKNNKDE